MASPYEIAKQHGYSDEEIDAYFGEKDPRYRRARDAGYSREEITEFLSKQKQPKESLGANIGRQAGRAGARTAETILGAPRAFGEFLEGLVPEERVKNLAGKVGLRKPVEKGFELSKKIAPYKLFPKSEDIRENITKHLFGERLEPKNKAEARSDEIISDFAALAIPLPGKQLKVLKPALLALGGNAASDIVEKMGGSKKEQAWAKIGTILAGSMINPKAAEKLKTDLFAQARKARPADAKVASKKLVKSVDKFEKELMKGDPDVGSKKKALDLIKKIKAKSASGDISIEDLEEFKRNINETRSSLYEEFKTDKVGMKAAKRNLDTVSHFVDNSLKEYGKTNPEWESFYRPANEAHGAIAQSKRVRYAIARHAKALGFPALLAELGLFHVAGAPAAVGSVAAGAAALGTGELLARVMKSPTLRKHYMNLMNAAMKEDVVVMRENLKRLDQELKKEKD